MFVYAKNVQLAFSDKLRRIGLTVTAGVVLTIGCGFLLAALWTWLAVHLGWGPLGASLAIGGGLVVIGLITLGVAAKERHPMPTTDALRLEVEQQLNLAANAALVKATDAADLALDRASAKAAEMMDLAENKIHSVADDLGYRANRMADRAEARVYTAARQAGETTARKLGFGAMADDEPRSGLATYAPLVGALALGLTVATRLQDWRHRDD